jgi:hypothetical protein
MMHVRRAAVTTAIFPATQLCVGACNKQTRSQNQDQHYAYGFRYKQFDSDATFIHSVLVYKISIWRVNRNNQKFGESKGHDIIGDLGFQARIREIKSIPSESAVAEFYVSPGVPEGYLQDCGSYIYL